MCTVSLHSVCDVCLADDPGGGSCFSSGRDGAVRCPARLCRREEEEAACHSAGFYGQICPSPRRQTGELHTDTHI